MCVACLELSTQPCRHRWYRLHHRCSPDFHLGNCPNKLQLQGWETRTEGCPFCEGWPQTHEEYRLLCQSYGGSRPSPALLTSSNSSSLSRIFQSSSPYSSCSRTPSLSRHLLQTRHDANIGNTKGSQTRRITSSDSFASIHGRNHGRNFGINSDLVHGDVFGSSSKDTCSRLTCAMGTKNRAMNDRLDIYLSSSMPGRSVADGPVDHDIFRHSDVDATAANSDNVDNIDTIGNSTGVIGMRTPPLPTSAVTSANTSSDQAIPTISVVGASDNDPTAGMRSKHKRTRKGMNIGLGKRLGFLFLN